MHVARIVYWCNLQTPLSLFQDTLTSHAFCCYRLNSNRSNSYGLFQKYTMFAAGTGHLSCHKCVAFIALKLNRPIKSSFHRKQTRHHRKHAIAFRTIRDAGDIYAGSKLECCCCCCLLLYGTRATAQLLSLSFSDIQTGTGSLSPMVVKYFVQPWTG